MKKLLSLLLCTFLLTAMLTACGSDNKDTDKNSNTGNNKPHPTVEDNTAAVTIGANGNLEITLNGEKVSWGNQILLLNRRYGLDRVALSPSLPNYASMAAMVNRQSPLKVPMYGADGRVSAYKNTLVGAFNSADDSFIYDPSQTATGVSGVGKTTSMSKRAFAIMNGKSAIASGKSAAANAAKDAIRLYGGKLAAVALQYDNAGADEVVAEADIAILKDLIATLETSVSNISESMKSAVLVVVTADKSLSDDEWAIAAGLADGKDIVEYIAALQTDYSSVAMPTELTDIIAKYEAIGNKLTAAKAALPTSGDGTWGDIKDVVDSLLTVSDIRIGGYTISEIGNSYENEGMGGDVVQDLFSKVSNGSLTYSLTGGIFATIADLTGDYTSSMAFPTGTTVEGLDLNMLGSKPVNIEGANGSAGSLGALAAVDAIANAQDPAYDPNATAPLTEVFGYIVDLLFRTNATESDLLLQVKPANRYAEGAMDIPEGSGSHITFPINADQSKEQIDAVAAGVRVVFFDSTGAIVAIAALDTDNGEVIDNTYTMDLRLRDYTVSLDGVIAITDPKADSKICALSTDAATAVSALVYLDCNVIANSTISPEMTLDLQFASSVERKPTIDQDLMGE